MFPTLFSLRLQSMAAPAAASAAMPATANDKPIAGHKRKSPDVEEHCRKLLEKRHAELDKLASSAMKPLPKWCVSRSRTEPVRSITFERTIMLDALSQFIAKFDIPSGLDSPLRVDTMPESFTYRDVLAFKDDTGVLVQADRYGSMQRLVAVKSDTAFGVSLRAVLEALDVFYNKTPLTAADFREVGELKDDHLSGYKAEALKKHSAGKPVLWIELMGGAIFLEGISYYKGLNIARIELGS
jgi:hypothetical protein